MSLSRRFLATEGDPRMLPCTTFNAWAAPITPRAPQLVESQPHPVTPHFPSQQDFPRRGMLFGADLAVREGA